MANESGWWMIEKHINGVPHWWVRETERYGYWDDADRWTTDPSRGRKYNTRADAEFVIGKDMVGCIATEHAWIKTEDAPQDIKEAV